MASAEMDMRATGAMRDWINQHEDNALSQRQLGQNEAQLARRVFGAIPTVANVSPTPETVGDLIVGVARVTDAYTTQMHRAEEAERELFALRQDVAAFRRIVGTVV